jgi:TP901 family phage tail tape measure protein
MRDGGTFETEVVLDADGGAVDRALSSIDARIRGIQQQVTKIMQGSKAAADAFGGSLQQTLNNFNKTVSTLERFQANIQKLDPNFTKQTQINAAYASRDKLEMDLANKKAAQEAKLWATAEATQLASAEKVAAKTRAELLANENTVQRIREQNIIKLGRDRMQQEVEIAKAADLTAMRATSSSQLGALRAAARNPYTSAEDQRTLLQVIELEKQRIRLIDQRIAAEERAAATSSVADGAVVQLRVRAARAAEQELLSTANLGAARARQAELEDRIATRAEQINGLAMKERSSAEQLLKLDQARLAVADKMVAQLENANRVMIQQAQPKAGTIGPPLPPGVRSPGSPGGGGGRTPPGLFGATGVSGIFARTFAYGTAASVIFSTVSAMKAGIDYSIQFEDKIQKLGAISGSSATQMKELAETIADVGKTSRFSTIDLADAATTLAQAGFTQADIVQSLKSISDLATAAGVDIQSATDVITSAIGSFQLQSGETSHIADVLTVALNRTKLNLQQVALGIQYAGATAHEENISFEELTATMAVMAQAGIRSGSTIGTGLRQFLTDLQNPTKKLTDEMKKLGLSMKDIDVVHLGLPEVLNRLAAAGFDASAAYGSLEKRGAAAYLVLKNNRDAINEEIIAQNQVGAAAQAAAKGQDSLAANWQRTKNVINDGVEHAIKPATEALKEYLHVINDAAGDPEIQRLQKLYNATSYFDFAAQDRIQVAMAHYLDQKKELTDAEGTNADAIEETNTAINKATDDLNKHTQTLQAVDDATERVGVRSKELKSDHTALAAETSTLIARFDGLAKYLDGAALSFDNLREALHAYRLEELRLQGQALATLVTQQRASKGEHFDAANSLMASARSGDIFSSLPPNIQRMMDYVAHHAGDTIALTALSNAGEKLGDAAGKRFVEQWTNQVAQGVSANTQAIRAGKQLDIVSQLSTPKGVNLQNTVSNLAGQPDSVIKAQIALMSKAMQGKSQSVQGAYLQLIAQAQSYLGSGSSPQAAAGREHHGRNLGARQDSAVDTEQVKAAQAQLNQAIKGLLDTAGSVAADSDIIISKTRTLTPDQFKANLERVNASLDDWIADRTKQVQDEMKRLKIDPNSVKGKNMLDALNDEIEAKKEEVQRKVGDAIAKAIDTMVNAIEEVAKRAEEAADHQQRLADARVNALGRANLAGRVPDYVQATYERAAARAKDQRDTDQVSIQEAELKKLIATRDELGSMLDAAGGAGLLGKDDPGVQRLQQLNDQIVALQNNTDELRASLGTDGLIPASFSANLQMAIDNYREVNHLTASFTELVSMHLTEAFGTAQEAFAQFFTDILSGTVSMKQAFANMVKSIIGYLVQLIAKMMAVKLMEILIGFATGSSGGSAPVSFDSGNVGNFSTGIGDAFSALPGMGNLYGGEIHALSGRYIGDGVPNRDSVPARIAKGEFVVRKRAVDSVGLDFMQRLNEHGAMALGTMGPKIILPPPAQQLMNVYVVAKDEQPTMGPNDVLVVIQQDIYRGGPTKQLIKQVAQGG